MTCDVRIQHGDALYCTVLHDIILYDLTTYMYTYTHIYYNINNTPEGTDQINTYISTLAHTYVRTYQIPSIIQTSAKFYIDRICSIEGVFLEHLTLLYTRNKITSSS